MSKKRAIIAGLMFACATTLNAQFAEHMRLAGISFSENYSKQNGTNYYPDRLFRTDMNKNFSQQYNINLQYGYFKKNNVLISFGVNYSYNQTQTESRSTDTNYYNYNLSNNTMNVFGVSGNISHYFPVKTKFGFYHTEGINLSYNYSTANSAIQNTAGSLVTTINVPSNNIGFTASLSAGAYFHVTEHLLFQTEINIFSLGMHYIWQHGNDNMNRSIDNTTISILSSGTLSPNATLASLSIGIRYLVPPKN